MKTSIFGIGNVVRARLLLDVLAFVVTAGWAQAANVTWDVSPGAVGAGNSAVTGGTGTWNTANGNWTIDGGSNNIAWVNGNNDTAIFGGTAGTVSLGEGITVGGLIFTSAYTVNSNTINFGVAGTISNTVAATIASALAGGVSITKSGGGTLTLSGANTYSGGTVINAGTISFGANNDSYLGATSGGITFSGGRITYSDDFVLNRAVTVNANWALDNRITVNGVLSGSSSISQSGADVVTFANANNTFTGTINSGYAMSFASLGDSFNPINNIYNGGIFTWTGGAKTLDLRPFTLNAAGAATLNSSGSGACDSATLGHHRRGGR